MKPSRIGRNAGVFALLLMAGLSVARADTLVWTGMTGDWFAVDNWTNTTSPENTRVPADGDDAVISQAGAIAVLSNSSSWLGSLQVSAGALVFSNWDTLLSATNISVLSGGILTCSGPFTNNIMSNRVNLLCSNLFVATGGAIDVAGRGYSGGSNETANYAYGHGPGGGAPGAGHGGAGGNAGIGLRTGTVYGSATAPLFPGSGGRAGSALGATGGHGGGAVRIVADHVVVSGSINANSVAQYATDSRCCGGSGGSVYITCSTITGTNGLVSADGSGSRFTGTAGSIPGGGGGGGRIAVIYEPLSQGALPVPSLRFSATAGIGAIRTNAGDIGTLYFPDNYFFSPTNLFNGQWLAPGEINVSLDNWTVSNTWTRLAISSITVSNTLSIIGTNFAQFRLEVTNPVMVNCGSLYLKGAALALGQRFYSVPPDYHSFFEWNVAATGPTLVCEGDLVMTNLGLLCVSAGATNSGMEAGYGARVAVGGSFTIASNCWVMPIAHATKGAAPLFTMSNLVVAAYGGFNATTLGYAGGPRPGNLTNASFMAYGPGISTNAQVGYKEANGGSGYGGVGGAGLYAGGGPAYGLADKPIEPGSGARAGWASGTQDGPFGGGGVQIRADDSVMLSGQIVADGGPGVVSYGPAASGGSIYIRCLTFIGDSNGLLQANGGKGYSNGGGGGGGRIAVWRANDSSPNPIATYADGGLGGYTNGEPGTIVWGWLPVSGTVIRFR